MAKKKVVVSFDFEHDKHYYYLLTAWNNGLVVVKLQPTFKIPEECYLSKRIQICDSFNEMDIIFALNNL